MSDTITVTGNIATEPDFKRTPAGVAITSFRVASSQRRFDRATGTWVDGVTNFYSISTFRGLAEHAFASFKKGDRVLLTGRLRLREWEAGERRGITAEIDAEAIGHDVLWGTTTFARDGAKVPRPESDRPEEWSSGGDAVASEHMVGGEAAAAVDAWAVPGSETGAEHRLVPAGAETPF